MATLAKTSRNLRDLLHAGVNFTVARLQTIGWLRSAVDWENRAKTCERCHLRVIRCGVSYCGQPFLKQIDRDEAVDGCGCPCRDKAKSRSEHCPIDHRQQPAQKSAGGCSCKWCNPR
jgi:hypothetical protein